MTLFWVAWGTELNLGSLLWEWKEPWGPWVQTYFHREDSNPRSDLGCSKVCGSRPLPGAACPVLETLSCVCSFAACCGWPTPEWVERAKGKNRPFSTYAKAESRGTDVTGWAPAHTVSAPGGQWYQVDPKCLPCWLPYCLSYWPQILTHHWIRVVGTVVYISLRR